MARARSYKELRLCEECGQPIEGGRGHQLLCRQCEEIHVRQKRTDKRPRPNRRESRQDTEYEDW